MAPSPAPADPTYDPDSVPNPELARVIRRMIAKIDRAMPRWRRENNTEMLRDAPEVRASLAAQLEELETR